MLMLVFLWSSLFSSITSAQVESQRFGLFVGIDKYTNPLDSLSSCVNDAVGFRNSLLSDSSLFEHPGNAMVLTDEDATETELKSRLSYFANILNPGDLFIYFHSGHGGQFSGEDTYLLCHDEQDFSDNELAIALSEFVDGVQIIVIVDACRSGGLINKADPQKPSTDLNMTSTDLNKTSTDSNDSWNFASNVLSHMSIISKGSDPKIDNSSDPKIINYKTTKSLSTDIAFITAAAYDENSYTGDPYSLYAGYVIDGFINGDGSDSTTADGYISFWELFQYSYPLALSNSTQPMTPQYSNETLLTNTIAAAKLAKAAPDPFEENDAFGEAIQISKDEKQWHSILPLGDNDYLKFTLAQRSTVEIFTDGTIGDTELFLYNGGQSLIATDDDSGDYTFSNISQTLDAGTYYIMVREVGSNDTIEAYSIYLTIDIPPPPTPENLTAEGGCLPSGQPIGSGKMNLQWDTVNEAISYNLYYDDDSSEPYDPQVNAQEGSSPVSTTSNTLSLTGLENHQTYYFAVTSVATNGESTFSTQVSTVPHQGFDVIPDIPFEVNGTGGNGEVTLNWHLIGNARSYTCYCSTSATDESEATAKSKSSTTVKVDGNLTSHLFSNLVTGQTYYLGVKAENESGDSEFSSQTTVVAVKQETNTGDTVASSSSSGGGCLIGKNRENCSNTGLFPLYFTLLGLCFYKRLFRYAGY